MSDRLTALCAGIMGLMLSCVFVGCSERVKAPNKDQQDSNSVSYWEVQQGVQDFRVPIAFSVKDLKNLNGGKAEISVSEGKDGLSAKVVNGEEWTRIELSAAKDAKLGVQELTVKHGNSTSKMYITIKAAAAK